MFCRTPFCFFVGNEKQDLFVLNAVYKIEIWTTKKTLRRKHTLHEPGDRVLFLSLGMVGHGHTQQIEVEEMDDLSQSCFALNLP